LKFIEKIQVLNFQVDSLKLKKETKQSFEVQFSREDNIKPDFINELTNILGLLSIRYSGYYDGWELENAKE